MASLQLEGREDVSPVRLARDCAVPTSGKLNLTKSLLFFFVVVL